MNRDTTIQEDLRHYAEGVEEHSAHPETDPWAKMLHAGADRIDVLEAALRGLADWLPAVGERSEYHAGYDSAREDVAALAHEALVSS